MSGGGACVELKVGETLRLDSGKIHLTLERKDGQRARLRIKADASVKIEYPKRVAKEAA